MNAFTPCVTAGRSCKEERDEEAVCAVPWHLGPPTKSTPSVTRPSDSKDGEEREEEEEGEGGVGECVSVGKYK